VVNRVISSGPAIAARSKLRQHPWLQDALVRALSLGRHGREYEESFRAAMFACVRPGDCIWDVGANVGLYSELFAAAVGPTGKVISFEPSPDCVAIIEERRRSSSVGTPWEVIAGALSDEDGDAWLSVAAGSTAPSNHLANGGGAATVPVRKYRADSIIAAGYPTPAVIKIDVEGFEGEVLDGMTSALDLPSLRAICVEVHFRALNERGKSHEPTRLVRLTEKHNFIVRWTDVSHFIARRRGVPICDNRGKCRVPDSVKLRCPIYPPGVQEYAHLAPDLDTTTVCFLSIGSSCLCPD
jgi:FkbM family methyltransferase